MNLSRYACRWVWQRQLQKLQKTLDRNCSTLLVGKIDLIHVCKSPSTFCCQYFYEVKFQGGYLIIVKKISWCENQRDKSKWNHSLLKNLSWFFPDSVDAGCDFTLCGFQNQFHPLKATQSLLDCLVWCGQPLFFCYPFFLS